MKHHHIASPCYLTAHFLYILYIHTFSVFIHSQEDPECTQDVSFQSGSTTMLDHDELYPISWSGGTSAYCQGTMKEGIGSRQVLIF